MNNLVRFIALLAFAATASTASAQAMAHKVADPVPLTAGEHPNASAASQAWVIERGERIDLALQRWAPEAGWAVSWSLPISWECPARVEFKGEFTNAVIEVIEALNQDGKRLRLRIFDKGRYMEVVSDAAL